MCMSMNELCVCVHGVLCVRVWHVWCVCIMSACVCGVCVGVCMSECV